MKMLIIDDHPLLIAGVRDVLHSLGTVVDCVEAGSAADALQCLRAESDIDAVCLDLNLPDESGLVLLERIRATREDLPVLVFSAIADAQVVDRALAAGAAGYVVKSSSRGDLVEAFEAFLATGRYVAPALRQALETYRSEAARAPRLTRRQREVLYLMARGMSNQEIAAELALVESTVKGHVSCLLDLMGAGNRTACVQQAFRCGLLSPREALDI
ncbi:MAG: response regulator transcription factor [Gammaproteobacteria bacterium]